MGQRVKENIVDIINQLNKREYGGGSVMANFESAADDDNNIQPELRQNLKEGNSLEDIEPLGITGMAPSQINVASF